MHDRILSPFLPAEEPVMGQVYLEIPELFVAQFQMTLTLYHRLIQYMPCIDGDIFQIAIRITVQSRLSEAMWTEATSDNGKLG
jgi:hypothetical protein